MDNADSPDMERLPEWGYRVRDRRSGVEVSEYFSGSDTMAEIWHAKDGIDVTIAWWSLDTGGER